MTGGTQSDGRVEGWKAIASRLGVSVRTVQDYEKRFGLPVRRFPDQDKSRVWALASELDEWQRKREAQPIPATPSPAQPERPDLVAVSVPSPADRPLDRRAWLRYGMIGAGIVGLAGMGAAALALHRASRKTPARYAIDGRTLTVQAEDQTVLWRHEFKEAIRPEQFASIFHPGESCVFDDLDGDGHLETLFCNVQSDASGGLFCFDRHGKPLWEFVPGRTMQSRRGETFGQPYGVGAFTVIHPPGSRAATVLVLSNHHYSYPCQVALLDGPTGRMVGEYWHRGHLHHVLVADLDQDTQPEVILGGVNDAEEYRRATVLVFGHREVGGGSRDPEGRPYFLGLDPGRERAEIFLPRTPLSAGKEFNTVRNLRMVGEFLGVEVVEDITELKNIDDYLMYEFTRDLRHVEVMLSNELESHYRALVKAGTIPAEPLAALSARLRGAVKVINRSTVG
jgi:hypothetical protein